MDNYAIIRINTLQSGDIAGAERHNMRLGEPEPNVDVSRSHLNRYIKTSPLGLKTAINTRIKDAGVTRKVQATAVLGIELMMTASPEFFDENMRAGKSAKLDEWINDCIKYANEYAGGPENVVQLVLHMDETTPHIQVVFVPISKDAPTTAKNKAIAEKVKLNAKPWTSPGKYQRMWTTYAAAMAKHGLKRGEFRLDNEAPKEHQTLKAGRSEVMKTAQHAEAVATRTENLVHERITKQDVVIKKQTAKIDLVVKQQADVIQEQRTLIQSITAQLKEAHETIKRLLRGSGANGPNQPRQGHASGQIDPVKQTMENLFKDDTPGM